MTDRYRNKVLDNFMEVTTEMLSAIAGKELEALRVQEILKRDPTMSFDRAVIIGMQEAANRATMRLAVLATSCDRTIRMAVLMAGEMTVANMKNGPRYERRLKLLTDLDKITKELTPPKMPNGPNSYRAVDEKSYRRKSTSSRG